ncbi:class I SAM-dependent methyltransferase [Eikenella sp. S3360]|uniref:Class I SAM-dependent methyltransferase n=1 Tax=Eikenella glucosivorans TaxID=2766967 RepID=A0ABS0NBR2_9NEIS|nr:class I SAM-dependent methyltransferase [Eikenella glucosivorans]MBH5329743.1 class I SAM-dependent methyltransferase [Eikenella glucosivorans]
MIKIENAVSETLLIPLYMKYRASQQPDPILRDEAACRLVPQIDYDFARFDRAKHTIVGTAIRSRYFDQITADFIRRQSHPVIVILGCGLDSRRERLGSQAGNAPFCQLDLPEVIELRRQLLPPQANETLLPASAFSTEWMEDLQTRHPEAAFLFLIEGVLMYFAIDTVRGLFQNLAARFSGSEIAFDMCNSWTVKNSARHEAMKNARARFQSSCDNEREAEQWANNLHLISSRLLIGDFPAEWKRTGWLSHRIMRLVRAMRESTRLLHYRID